MTVTRSNTRSEIFPQATSALLSLADWVGMARSPSPRRVARTSSHIS